MFGRDRIIILIFELEVDIKEFHKTRLALLLFISVDFVFFAIRCIELLEFEFEEVILCNEFFNFFLDRIQCNLQVMINLN